MRKNDGEREPTVGRQAIRLERSPTVFVGYYGVGSDEACQIAHDGLPAGYDRRIGLG